MSFNRRAALTLGAGAALAVAVPAAAQASTVTGKLRQLEKRHNARLGVFATDTGTGRTVLHRADELFPMCSTFKTIAAAAILRKDRDGTLLGKVITYTQAEVDKSGYGPETGKPENLANGMTVSALCEATIIYSDNCAANLLLRELGGPTAISRFSRSIGDPVTRLDRWEPELNSAEPGRITDTTSPRAIGQSYARLTLGHALNSNDSDQLTKWLLANTTGGNRIRAGLPSAWRWGDKTGTGSYGTTNDVGIAFPAGRAPIVIAVLSTRKDEPTGGADEPLLARTAELVAATFS
ncbi:beta-lactamase class A [Lentzea albidocapillata subsp. violacea]|uniref:Beta-lactamase n=1 Tax=Lentzea albidocapillata subsp. violacea TaxID=128104 RepID=A0A1G9QPU8_9PSEU|nr:class A beta-lactamase [Lentzea albidocapillata]SDM13028.1 beta-lactamase class A [Lentzea albidocapillata subsp. violacea]